MTDKKINEFLKKYTEIRNELYCQCAKEEDCHNCYYYKFCTTGNIICRDFLYNSNNLAYLKDFLLKKHTDCKNCKNRLCLPEYCRQLEMLFLYYDNNKEKCLKAIDKELIMQKLCGRAKI